MKIFFFSFNAWSKRTERVIMQRLFAVTDHSFAFMKLKKNSVHRVTSNVSEHAANGTAGRLLQIKN